VEHGEDLGTCELNVDLKARAGCCVKGPLCMGYSRTEGTEAAFFSHLAPSLCLGRNDALRQPVAGTGMETKASHAPREKGAEEFFARTQDPRKGL
jgi:hypothetical protein